MGTFTTSTRTLTDLATSVRDARLAHGMSQAELAEAAHLNRSWVSLFESGRTPNASLTKVLAMLDALGMTVRVTYPVPDGEQTADNPPLHAPPAPEPGQRHDDLTDLDNGRAGTTPVILNPVALEAARRIRAAHRERSRAHVENHKTSHE